MTIDVEDYFHVEALASTIDRKDWGRLPARVAACSGSRKSPQKSPIATMLPRAADATTESGNCRRKAPGRKAGT
jgi:hypothetical protein